MPTCWRRATSSSPAAPNPSATTSRCAARTWGTDKKMELLLHQMVSGLATGSIYASVALALVMIYQATHLVNFAQGEMAMFATYICWTMINAGLPYWVAFFLTIVVAFIGGVLIQRVVMRPVQDAPVLSVVIVFIGLLVIFNSVAGWIYSYTIKPFPSPFPAKSVLDNSF